MGVPRTFSFCVCAATVLTFSIGVASALDCPQVAPTSAPVWVDIVSNNVDSAGIPGESFLFSGLQGNPRTPGQSLPMVVQTPPSAIGAADPHTFPGGPPYFYSNSSGASINCFPGIDASLPGGCPAGQVGFGCLPDGDCTGQPIIRAPASGIESAFARGITGIDYLGTFEGAGNQEPGSITEVVFFHQNADYLGQAEYGFYRELAAPNQLLFYWQTNANCTLRPNHSATDTMCTTVQGDRQPATLRYTDDLLPPGNAPALNAFCTIDLGPVGGFGLYYYSMWIYSDHGTLKFGMSILDPNTFQPVVPAVSIDPNAGAATPWFPISALNGGGGYVTAGIGRFDPFDRHAFSSPAPSMSIRRLVIGLAPQ
jgi:hypothetical protein